MDRTDEFFKLLNRAFSLLAFLAVFIVSYAVYDLFFGHDKILKRLEETTQKLSAVIEQNKELEFKLAQTEMGIREVHKSLLESQIKLSGLIKDTRGSTVRLHENAETVKEDLTGIINDINVVLAKGDSNE